MNSNLKQYRAGHLHMALNLMSTTQSNVIGHTRVLFRIDLSTLPILRLNNVSLAFRDSVKNGLNMNQTLNWAEHTTVK